jgi:predicted  nucleic acid-binding Zn-ribbon protein
MKDIKTLLLGLLSIGLVSTWVYHLYDKMRYSQKRTEVYIKDSIAVAEAVSDSLQKIYTATINNLDTRLTSTRNNADSLKFQLEVKLNEIYKLKNEIYSILKNRGSTKDDMGVAEKKIATLQELVNELKGQKSSMEEEKKRLGGVMEQLSGEISNLQENMKKLDEENQTLTEKVSLASIFVASELKFSPVALKNSKEQETSVAKKTTKLVISFAVQNNVTQYSNAEVFVVITQPDGKVLKNDIWESSTIETSNGTRKSYTIKLRFEYLKGETKHLVFSLNADEYQQGNYTMQVYHNGYLIGQTTKTLN